MVLFVLAIIYIILLGMMLTSTGKRMFQCCAPKKLNGFMRVFVTFYTCILVQIVLTDTLYWLYFAKIVNSSADQTY